MSALTCGCDPHVGWTCAQHDILSAGQGAQWDAYFGAWKDEEADVNDAHVESLRRAGEAGLKRADEMLTTEFFTVKDSGERAQFASGMVRDTQAAKVDYSLCFDGPLIERLAAHLTKGAQKYAPRNWMLATGQEELERFKTSAVRHFVQWLRGDQDEDHFAAVVFNLNGAEYVKERMRP